MIIHLISSPRTVSTSLMYAFDNRADTVGIDEPFYGYYLNKTGVDHPGGKRVLDEMDHDSDKIFLKFQEYNNSDTVLFIKNMAHHMIDLPLDRFSACENLILIRDPARIINSFSKVIQNPTIDDIGIKAQWEIYENLRSLGSKVFVMDSSIILKNPEKALRHLCDIINLPFDQAMLEWEAGPRDIDGSWAQHWYKSTHQLTGFKPYDETAVTVDPAFTDLYETAKTYYDKLMAASIHVTI